MAGANFRDAYGFDPEDYNGTGGGLPGMLWRAMQQQQQGVLQPGAATSPGQASAPGYIPGDDDSPQGGLLGRLLALQAEQSQYQPSPAGNGQSPFGSQSQSLSQGTVPADTSASDQQRPLRRIYIYPRAQHDATTDTVSDGAATDPTNAYSSHDSGTYGAQDGLPGRLLALLSEQRRYQPGSDSNGNSSSLETSTPMPPPQSMALGKINPSSSAVMDPIDIGKSLAIGAANGLVNSVGLPGDALTGFGYFPEHLVENLVREKLGYPDLAPGQPGYLDELTSGAIRHGIESHWREFYQPKSRAGRYAETIGEMLPMAVGGGVASLRQLPGTLLKHAVAPGAVVQTLEETFPESKAGKTLQKAYPIARRATPYVPAVTRYLAKRIIPY